MHQGARGPARWPPILLPVCCDYQQYATVDVVEAQDTGGHGHYLWLTEYRHADLFRTSIWNLATIVRLLGRTARCWTTAKGKSNASCPFAEITFNVSVAIA